jgi:hypothetical protein
MRSSRPKEEAEVAGEFGVADALHATAVRMISRTTVSAPRISPSYSSSILPVMPGSAA